MKPWNALLAVCLLVPRLGFAAEPPNMPSENAKRVAFEALVDRAHQASLSGHLVEAADAYFAALEMQRDPVISGRLGLILMKLGRPDRAAEQLQEAVVRGQKAPAWERQAVQQAYDKAKSMTTLVNVEISHAGTKVTYDGTATNPRGLSGFWMFAMAGEHTLRARFEGYDDGVATFTAKPGEEISVSLKLVPVVAEKLPELPALVVATPGPEPARKFPPLLNSSNITTDSNYSKNEDPYYEDRNAPKPPPKKTWPRFSVNGGLTTIFGVASWNPAIGGVLGVGLRVHEHVSLGLEGRAAWLTTGVADLSGISAMTAGGLLSACGHLRWFFGCALGYAGTINIDFANPPFIANSFSNHQPGLGGRIGTEFRTTSPLVVRVAVDIIGTRSGIAVGIGNVIIVEQPPVLFSAQIAGGWEF